MHDMVFIIEKPRYADGAFGEPEYAFKLNLSGEAEP